MFTRTETKPIKVGQYTIGHQNKIIIQSMTNTKTKDVEATVHQIKSLLTNGCEIVRVAVLDMEDAQAISAIMKEVNCPIVADIHFDYRLAIAAIEAGVDKIRLNPGNIGPKENVVAVVNKCKEYSIRGTYSTSHGSISSGSSSTLRRTRLHGYYLIV